MGQQRFSQGLQARSSGLGPMTNCPVEWVLEPVSTARVGVVSRDSTILQLASEGPDATLPYSPKQWTFSASETSRTVATPVAQKGLDVSVLSLKTLHSFKRFVRTTIATSTKTAKIKNVILLSSTSPHSQRTDKFLSPFLLF